MRDDQDPGSTVCTDQPESATSNFFSAPFNFPQDPKDPLRFRPDPADSNASPKGANLAVYVGQGTAALQGRT
jgi:hypothetical protein